MPMGAKVNAIATHSQLEHQDVELEKMIRYEIFDLSFYHPLDQIILDDELMHQSCANVHHNKQSNE